jgi:hypothetical protein
MLSYFESITDNRPSRKIDLNEFLAQVGAGTWGEKAKAIREEENKEKRQQLKKSLPYVTISGDFEIRRKDSLVQHSGFIAMDFDEIEDVEEAREILKKDEYTYSVFTSVSGRGLCAIIRIEPERHLDAFLALETYYGDNYGLIIDRACKDTTRARIVSHDPKIYTKNLYEPRRTSLQKVLS